MNNPAEQRHCAAYENVAMLTTLMLKAARNADWDRLVELETECRSAFITVRTDTPEPPHSAEFVRHKSLLLRQILLDDAEIRKLVEPRVEELANWLGSAGHSRQLNNAYLPGA